MDIDDEGPDDGMTEPTLGDIYETGDESDRAEIERLGRKFEELLAHIDQDQLRIVREGRHIVRLVPPRSRSARPKFKFRSIEPARRTASGSFGRHPTVTKCGSSTASRQNTRAMGVGSRTRSTDHGLSRLKTGGPIQSCISNVSSASGWRVKRRHSCQYRNFPSWTPNRYRPNFDAQKLS